MKRIQKIEKELIHYIMTFMGGFIGLYAICAYGNYGSAQTGNLMNMVIDFVGRNHFDFAVRFGALVVFCAGIVVSWLMIRAKRFPMRDLALIVDAAGLAVAAFMQEELYPFFHLYPLFFATSFQWGVFNGVGKYGSASLFVTGNLKKCVTYWLRYWVDKEKSALEGARIYTITIGSYVLGGFAGCVAVKAIGAMGAFYGYIPLFLVECILIAEKDWEK